MLIPFEKWIECVKSDIPKRDCAYYVVPEVTITGHNSFEVDLKVTGATGTAAPNGSAGAAGTEIDGDGDTSMGTGPGVAGVTAAEAVAAAAAAAGPAAAAAPNGSDEETAPRFCITDLRILKISNDAHDILQAFDVLRVQQDAARYLMESIDLDRLRRVYQMVEKETTRGDDFISAIEDICGMRFAEEVMQAPAMGVEEQMSKTCAINMVASYAADALARSENMKADALRAVVAARNNNASIEEELSKLMITKKRVFQLPG